MKLAVLAARVDARRQVAQQRALELAPRERGIQLSRVDAREACAQARVDHGLRQLWRGKSPDRKQRFETGPGESLLAIAAHILEEQVAEGHVRESLAHGRLDRDAHPLLVDLVRAGTGDRDDTQWQPRGSRLRLHVPAGRLGALMEQRYRESLPLGAFRLITFVSRTQGFMVAPGNPLAIGVPADLCREGVRLVNRQRGSGTRALLEYLISSAGLDRARIAGYDSEETTHGAVAALIAGRQADVGFGVQAAAAQYGLGFVPILTERYYLACRASHVESPAMERLLELLRGEEFTRMVAALPGYTTDQPGQILDRFETTDVPETP